MDDPVMKAIALLNNSNVMTMKERSPEEMDILRTGFLEADRVLVVEASKKPYEGQPAVIEFMAGTCYLLGMGCFPAFVSPQAEMVQADIFLNIICYGKIAQREETVQPLLSPVFSPFHPPNAIKPDSYLEMIVIGTSVALLLSFRDEQGPYGTAQVLEYLAPRIKGTSEEEDPNSVCLLKAHYQLLDVAGANLRQKSDPAYRETGYFPEVERCLTRALAFASGFNEFEHSVKLLGLALLGRWLRLGGSDE